jgi:hypothetical protein
MMASSLLINQKDLAFVHGYGSWNAFDLALNSAFGAANITVSTGLLPSLGTLLTYDAVVLVPRTNLFFPFSGQPLTPGEISDLRAYIATGRRVLLDGENANWEAWNNSIMAVAGGRYISGSNTGSFLEGAISAHELTTGVSTIYWNAEGIAYGGTQLFDTNIATIWGSGNVLTVLSNNALDGSLSCAPLTCGNTQFALNTANWLAQFPSPESPEPTTFALCCGGFALLFAVEWRARRQKC